MNLDALWTLDRTCGLWIYRQQLRNNIPGSILGVVTQHSREPEGYFYVPHVLNGTYLRRMNSFFSSIEARCAIENFWRSLTW